MWGFLHVRDPVWGGHLCGRPSVWEIVCVGDAVCVGDPVWGRPSEEENPVWWRPSEEENPVCGGLSVWDTRV